MRANRPIRQNRLCVVSPGIHPLIDATLAPGERLSEYPENSVTARVRKPEPPRIPCVPGVER